MSENLRQLEAQIGYQFRNQNILKEALTHGSARSLNINLPHHERLEFLGDAVLSTVMTEYLFFKEGSSTPGQLTERRKGYVCDAKQNEIAEEIQVQRYVKMGPGVNNFRRYGEFVEAIIGAVFIDAGKGDGDGLKKAKQVIFKLWGLQQPAETSCVIA